MLTIERYFHYFLRLEFFCKPYDQGLSSYYFNEFCSLVSESQTDSNCTFKTPGYRSWKLSQWYEDVNLGLRDFQIPSAPGAQD